MNIISEIGELLVKYHNYIEVALIIIAVLILVFLMVEFLRNSYKKSDLLDEINTTVTEINTTVKSINDKKTDVIYIDNRSAKESGDIKSITPDITYTKAEKTEEDADAGKDEAPEEAGNIEEHEVESENKVPAKFGSRDCAVSKQGKVYTVEELVKQIKE